MASEKNASFWLLLGLLILGFIFFACTKSESGSNQDIIDSSVRDHGQLDVTKEIDERSLKDFPDENDLLSDLEQQIDSQDTPPAFDEVTEPGVPRFSVYDLQNLGNVRSIAGTSDLGIIAVGDNGLVAHMRDISDSDFFLGPTPPDNKDLFAIGSRHGTTVAVGEKGLVLRLKDFGWEVLEAPTSLDLYGVAVVDSDDFYVCGAKGQIFHFRENSWTKEDTGITYNLYAIVPTGTGAIAAGDFGTVIELRGGIWQRQQVASPASSLRGLFRTPDGITFAVGTLGTVVLQKEGVWQLQITGDNYDPPRDLYSIFAFSSSEVYAVGDKGAVLKFDGKKWRVAPVAGPYNQFADLRAVWGVETEDGTKKVIAMGLDSRGLALNNKTFEDLNLAVTQNLYGVTLDPDGRTIVVGDKGVAFAFDGKRFLGIETFTNNSLRSVSWPYAVGDKGTLVKFQAVPDIRATMIGLTPPDDLTDIHSTPDFAVAVSRQGTVFRIDDNGVATDDELLGNSLYAVCIADPSKIVVGADKGLLFILENENARTLNPAGGFRAIRDLYCDDSFFVAVGDYGLLLKCDYTSCVSLFEEPATFFFTVGYAKGFGLVAGWAGRILAFDNMFRPRALDSPTLQTFRALSIRQGVATLVGDSGLFVTCDWQTP